MARGSGSDRPGSGSVRGTSSGIVISWAQCGAARGLGRENDAIPRFRDRYADAMAGESVERFKRWFWRPPRAHGEIIPDRAVSSLELFYDLVYVAVIGQAAHHLAQDVTAQTIAEFGVVFALIWIAWVTGTLYLELHGRDDGRTRSAVFVQMGILALLAVFTDE